MAVVFNEGAGDQPDRGDGGYGQAFAEKWVPDRDPSVG